MLSQSQARKPQQTDSGSDDDDWDWAGEGLERVSMTEIRGFYLMSVGESLLE